MQEPTFRSVFLDWDLDPAMALVLVALRESCTSAVSAAWPAAPRPRRWPCGPTAVASAPVLGVPRLRHPVGPGPLRRGAVLAAHGPAPAARDGGAGLPRALGPDHARAAGQPPGHAAHARPRRCTTRWCGAVTNPDGRVGAVRRDAVRPLLLAAVRAVAAQHGGCTRPCTSTSSWPAACSAGSRSASTRCRGACPTRPACCSCCWPSRSTPSSAWPCCRPTATRSAPTCTARSCARGAAGLAADQRLGAGVLWALGDLFGLGGRRRRAGPVDRGGRAPPGDARTVARCRGGETVRLDDDPGPAWPPLGVAGRLPARLRRGHLLRRRAASRWPTTGICEAAWDGQFADGGFDETDLVFGSGVRVRGDRVVTFVPAGAPHRPAALAAHRRGLSRVQLAGRVAGVHVGGSLRRVPPRGTGTIFSQPRRGHGSLRARRYPPRPATVSLTYFDNLVWDGERLEVVEKPFGVRDLGSLRDVPRLPGRSRCRR